MINRWLFRIACAVIALALAGCAGVTPQAGSTATSTGEGQTTLTVMAAASLTEPFKAAAEQFQKEHPGVQVVFNFAGSQQLAQQLASGAPADVFASANLRQMAAAVEAGRVTSGSERIFARNRLVVVTPRDNPAGILKLEDLAQAGIRLVLAAQEVPAGQYTLEFLEKASQEDALGENYRAAVLGNVVSYEENVRAVLTKVRLGEADAGIVYYSDSVSDAGHVQRVEIPEALNPMAEYPIAAVSDSQNADLAEAFVDFIVEGGGRLPLAAYGFDAAE